MTWFAVGTAAIGAIGGAMSDKGGGTTVQNQLDPRIAKLLYGESGAGGLLNNVNNLYTQQAGQGGLNPMQNAGLEMQRQTLTDPRFTQGFDAMRSAGMGLLGAPVAGNPFTQQQGAPQFGNPQQAIQQQPMQGGPLGLPSAAMQPVQQQSAPQQAQPSIADLMELTRQQQANPPAPYISDPGSYYSTGA